MNPISSKAGKQNSIKDIDDNFSNRFIELDPKGYFLIKVNQKSKELIVEHFKNTVDERGRALDPETGQILKCTGQDTRSPFKIFKGRTAKEVGIKITEAESPSIITKFDHALYLGRELQKAETCLVNKTPYIQD